MTDRSTSGAHLDPTEDQPPEALSRNVKVLGLVSFAQDAGSEMLYPLLPAFIVGVLGAPVLAVAVAEGAADATASIMKLIAGRLASARHRRPWIGAGYGLAAVGKAIVAAAFTWPVVLMGRVTDRVGKGIRGVPRDALIADDTPPELRGRAFGFHRSADTAGAVVGPLVGLALLEAFGGKVRPVLVIAVIPAVISASLVALVRERRPVDEPADADVDGGPAPADPNDGRGLWAHRTPLPRTFWRTLAPLAAFAAVNSTDVLLLERASTIGFATTTVIVVYVLYNTVYALLGYPAGWVADRLGPRRVYAAGLAVFAIVYLGLGHSTSEAAVWVLLPCYGAYTALTDGVSKAWISNLVDSEQRAWALGVQGATVGFGVLVAGIWSGLLWHRTGQLALTISGVVAAAVAVWIWVIDPSRPSPSASPSAPAATR